MSRRHPVNLDEPTLQTWVHLYTLLMVIGLAVGACAA